MAQNGVFEKRSRSKQLDCDEKLATVNISFVTIPFYILIFGCASSIIFMVFEKLKKIHKARLNLSLDGTEMTRPNLSLELRPIVDDEQVLRLERLEVAGDFELVQAIRVLTAQLVVNDSITKTSRDLIFATTALYIPRDVQDDREDLTKF